MVSYRRAKSAFVFFGKQSVSLGLYYNYVRTHQILYILLFVQYCYKT
jgi:hypothetical protein